MGLDDNFKQQGSIRVCFTAVGEERDINHGRVFMGHVIGCPDQYYEHWVNTTYGAHRIERVAPASDADDAGLPGPDDAHDARRTGPAGHQ